MATDKLVQNFFDRHAAKVDFNGPRGCWLWTAAKFRRGYGAVGAGGKLRPAHREAYENKNGAGSAAGLVVRHKCDTPSCVNPDHLELGTHADNSRDMVERGRSARGEAHGMSKLTEDKVRYILAECVPGTRTHGQTALARKFGVDRSLIGLIVTRKIWAHVPAGTLTPP